MSGQGNNRPNEVIEHAPVTLRRYRTDDAGALYHAVMESLAHLRPWLPWSSASPRSGAARWTSPRRKAAASAWSGA